MYLVTCPPGGVLKAHLHLPPSKMVASSLPDAHQQCDVLLLDVQCQCPSLPPARVLHPHRKRRLLLLGNMPKSYYNLFLILFVFFAVVLHYKNTKLQVNTTVRLTILTRAICMQLYACIVGQYSNIVQ